MKLEGAASSEDLLTTTAAARLADVSADTIRHLERIGELPALKTTTGVRLFKRVDVERLTIKRAGEKGHRG